MKAIAQNEIIALVADLNSFADRSEQLINATQSGWDRKKSEILNQHSINLANLDSAYKQNCSAIASKSNQTINDAKRILIEINNLDGKLEGVDKYYVKTKKKKEEELAGTTSQKYSDATDYFNTMEKIKADYSVIFKKYSEDILPSLLNGLNYLFSNKRKKDYEELIILRNTVSSFVTEIETELPSVTQENLDAVRESYLNQRSSETERQQRELAGFESGYNSAMDDVADKICADLESILPDEFVDYLSVMAARYYENSAKVNTTSEVQDEVLDMIFVDYPVDFFVQSQIVASLIKDKCSPLMTDGEIRFPIMMSTTDAPVWLIKGDNSNVTAVQDFAHSVMYGLLSSCPVARLSYRVVDPENRGNSIFPFFDAKKKLPELFSEKICISKDDVTSELSRINGKIENILQDKLGNQYDNIFDYASNNEEYTVSAEMLLLFDFPKGFDERALSELRNIIRNGSKCGIYVLISYTADNAVPNYSREYQQSLQAIFDMSVEIRQDENGFTYRGLPISYSHMPEKAEFAKFFSKYMLIYEGMKNRGIAFSSLIKKLVDARDSIELDEHITMIGNMMENYNEVYAQVPDIESGFPERVTLGNVFYPADIFSDSIGYQRILESFGKEHDAGMESNSYVELPLTFDLRNGFNLFLNCPESAQKPILRFSHHVIWDFLSFIPVTKVNVCIFDSEQRGNSVIPFLDFRKKVPETFDENIYSSSEKMAEKLKSLNNHIDEFIQDKLGNKYKDILDYNKNTPSRAEPVTLLMIYDFPSGIDGRSFDQLTNILRNGNKCGIYTVICFNPEIKYSRYENIDERIDQISRFCSSIEYKDGHYGLLPYNLRIDIPDELDADTVDGFIKDYYEKSEKIKRKGLSFKDIISKDKFSFDSSKSLEIPIGIGDGDSIVSLTMGIGSSHHGLIAGATGSGKSTLLHTLIMSSMLHYSPDQLHLYLMDFKSGTEFKIYESVRLPHIQLLALDAMQEFGESILENLVAEMEHRGALFKEVGQTNLKGYKEQTGKVLPRILVIMDEFQILFNLSSNRKVAARCAELAKRIVTEGRAFGVHLLMATQSTKVITNLSLESGVIEQMRIRVGMKCSDSDARYLFPDQDAKALAMMKGPMGTAVMNLDYSEQPNVGLRVAFCDDNMKKELLNLISEEFKDMPCNLQVFEGGRNTDLLDYYRSNNIALTNELPVRIHMGSLIKVAPPFAINIDKRLKHNLLICGANERMASRVFNNYMISALLNKNVSVYCMDGDYLVGDDSYTDFYGVLNRFDGRFKLAQTRSDIIKFINEIYEKYQIWKRQNTNESIFVAIKNVQFIDIVISLLKGERIHEEDYIDEEPVEETPPENNGLDLAAMLDSVKNLNIMKKSNSEPVSDKFQKLVSEGSNFGINFVISSLEPQVIRECGAVIKKFPERIIFSLSDNDSERLIENVKVADLRDNIVVYTDGIRTTCQMKPYITPTSDELSSFLKGLASERQEET